MWYVFPDRRFEMIIVVDKEPWWRSGHGDSATVWTVRDSNPAASKRFYLVHNVQTGSEAHTASYSIGIGGYFPRVKGPRSEVEVKNE
jgi:hypothetical protein